MSGEIFVLFKKRFLRSKKHAESCNVYFRFLFLFKCIATIPNWTEMSKHLVGNAKGTNIVAMKQLKEKKF
jgi:hypothetical protein